MVGHGLDAELAIIIIIIIVITTSTINTSSTSTNTNTETKTNIIIIPARNENWQYDIFFFWIQNCSPILENKVTERDEISPSPICPFLPNLSPKLTTPLQVVELEPLNIVPELIFSRPYLYLYISIHIFDG
ncbi:hypothetical protein TCAL_05121 [Tigriopus californicus]|uniref:Uncharacterized protein n=1 Tax=Tigriopus californicus TaxID=6832 RepID=A0A553PPB3_TIGCA|nr:hypothetical protein TCAL_05121 [Tigriopus californicus]